MLKDYYIDPEVNCAFIRHSGEFDRGEGVAGIQIVRSDPQYVAGMNIYRDLTDSGLPDEYNYQHFKTNINSQLSYRAPHLVGNCKIGWLVGSPRDYKLVHQIAISTQLTPESLKRQPFREQDSLFNWLGLPGNYKVKFAN